MALNPNLQKFTTASPIISSYSYTDIADGTGVQIFYGARETDDSSSTYFLSSNAIYPDATTTSIGDRKSVE